MGTGRFRSAVENPFVFWSFLDTLYSQSSHNGDSESFQISLCVMRILTIAISSSTNLHYLWRVSSFLLCSSPKALRLSPTCAKICLVRPSPVRQWASCRTWKKSAPRRVLPGMALPRFVFIILVLDRGSPWHFIQSRHFEQYKNALNTFTIFSSTTR